MLDIDQLNQKFLSYNHVVECLLKYDEINAYYNLELILAVDLFKQTIPSLKIRFVNITNLEMRNFGNKFTQFVDLHIEKNHDGWDDVKYNVFQIEEENISFKCLIVEEILD